MAKIVKLKSSDLIRLVEETLNILPNQNDLPKHVTNLEKLVNEGKRTINRMYNVVLDLNLRDVIQDTEKYKKLLNDMTETQDVYSKKYNQYWDTIDSYWDDHLNNNLDPDTDELYKKGDKLVTELDNIQNDMYKLVDIFGDIFGKMDTSLIEDFPKLYPDQTINIDKSLNISNNEN